MLQNRMNALLVSLTVLTTFLLSACSKTAEEAKTNEPAPRVESTIAPTARMLALASPTPSRTPANKPSTPPNPTEIRDTVSRVFERVATPDASRPGYVVGDFNGDGSEDLAVAIKAGENSLGEINSELANWLLEDPRNVVIRRTASTSQPPDKPVRAEKGDPLLAIIHGVGPQGWRAPAAKQTYVLKNGAGSNMEVQTAKALRNTKPKLPPLKGDVIKETVGNSSGFIFWNGARYAWYPTSPDE